MQNRYEYKNVRPDGLHLNDCHVRTLVQATGMGYNGAEFLFIKKQVELKAKHSCDKGVVFAVLQDLGFIRTETINPNTGRGSMKLSSFLREHKGRYILYTRNHICYAENGKVLDTWDCTNCLLCGYYIIN